jgi:hypothetical protein
MNESRPADSCPEDPALSRLYRAAADDAPPPALDAAILAAAHGAVAPRLTPKRTWWQRLRLPISVAATLMLTVMLSLTVQQNPPEVAEVAESRAQRPTPAGPAPTAAASSVQPAEKERTEAAEKTGVSRAPMPAPAAPAGAPEPAPVPAATARPFPAMPAEKKTLPATPSPQTRDAAFPVTAEGRAVAADSAADTVAKAERSEPARERGTLALPAPGAAPVAAPSAAGAQRNSAAKRAQPQGEAAWLEEIRALRRQGKHEEAARRLAEFRTAYPDYPLPDDLK